MITKSELIQIHYEFAMAIGNSLDLHKMLRNSLTILLKKLNCHAGGVHFFNTAQETEFLFKKVITIPKQTQNVELYQQALNHLSGDVTIEHKKDLLSKLPISKQTKEGFYHIAGLSDLGIIILCKSRQMDEDVMTSLAPIFTKLSVACRACQQNEELLRHQNSLQKIVKENTGELIRKNQQLILEIEQRKASENALRISEEKYRELVENANSIILRWDTEGRITFFNEYAQTFFGFSEKEIIGRHVVGTIVPETETTGRDLGPLMEDICNNPQKYEYNVNENMRKDGSRVWIAWTNKVLTDDRGQLIGAMSIGADITGHRKIEEALRQSEKSLAEAQKIARLGNWTWDISADTLTWSDEIYRIFGIQPQEFEATYEAFSNFIHPGDREMVEQAVHAALYQNTEYDINHRIIIGDGEERIVQEQGRVSFDDQGTPVRMVGIVRDVTESFRSERRFKLAAEAISDLIYEWDIRDDSLNWFGDVDAALGFEPGEFEQTIDAWLKRIHPDDISKLSDAVEHHRTSTEPISYEYRVQRKDGTWVYWSDYGVPVLDGDGRPYQWVGACTDITEKKKAEQELIESEERYRALFTNEIDAISIFEIETRKIIDVNDAWIKLYGYSRDEIVTMTVEDVSAEPESTQKAVKHSAKTGTVFIPERHHRKKDGTVFTVELAAGPFTWKGRRLMYALVRDITERKKAEQDLKQSEQMLAETQKLAQLGSWEFDAASETIKWSEETFRISGREPKETQTLQEYLDTVHPDDLPLLDKSLKTSATRKEPYEVELRHRRPDGSYNHTLTRGKPIFKDDQLIKFIGSVLDITERKQAEQELEKAKESAEEASRAKSSFLANMSHELRTPLNAIIGFSEMMTRDPSLSKDQQGNLETIVRSGEHLLSLINDVLEFSKIEAGRITLNPENFDFHHLLLGLNEMFSLRARQKQLDLAFDVDENIPQHIQADQSKIRQVLINLLGNAVKFTDKGRITLKVSVGAEKEPGKMVIHFQVVDTGRGIEREEQHQVFEAFFQAGKRQPANQGTGLGLPISQRFVRMMGGELSLSSTIGKGTTFSFSIPVKEVLPVSDALLHPIRRVVRLEKDQPDWRLVVAEDNETSRELLVKLLTEVGFTVKEAVNGREAVEIWEKWQPHMIWMDMRMPEMDGYEATQYIKSQPGGGDTVIIALTASAFEEDRLKVIAHGGNDFVRKPFREIEIFQMLEKHLGVVFIRESPDKTMESQKEILLKNTIKGSVSSLPESLHRDLIIAVEEIDFDATVILIKEVEKYDKSLGDFLSKLVIEYKFDILQQILKGREE